MRITQPEAPLILKLIFYALLFLALSGWVAYDLITKAGPRVTFRDKAKIFIIAIFFNIALGLSVGVWSELWK